MRPVDMQPVGAELAIKWDDGTETFVPLEAVRRACPCAGCKGEVDIMGNLYKNPDKPLTPAAFKLVRIERVGGYAIQPTWGDGHSTGLFSFEYLTSSYNCFTGSRFHFLIVIFVDYFVLRNASVAMQVLVKSFTKSRVT